ncbi:hypothetical protein CFOL_v3_04098 [Cephalotus follicularis]|uniref:Uncharacterized protein n=1 Tax=Cephalotus follicularis TaxID=3775 RepID=A0A1Q3AXY5_CEPFO|nr:hypothetical protein CFOL_v3_04098 [Cephalotus follicularis]
MATQQEKTASICKTSPSSDDDSLKEDCGETMSAFSGCGCFQNVFSVWRRRSNNGTHRYQLQHQEETKEGWLENKLKKVKVLSELLAGPKWKNFIRRFKKRRLMQFQYDPQSYALNFDDGIDMEVENIGAHLDFTARYASPVGLNKGPQSGF